MLTLLLPSENDAGEFCRAAAGRTNVRTVITGPQNRLWSRVENSLTEGVFLIAGTAAPLDDDLRPGTLFLPAKIGGLSDLSFAPDAALRAAVKNRLTQNGKPVAEGALLSSPAPVTTREESVKLWERGYSAVDMESWWLLALLAKKGQPAAVLRVLSDSAGGAAAGPAQSMAASAALSSALACVLEGYNDVQ